MFRRGLTLIELLAVITLITMVAGIALAGLSSGSDNARLRAMAAELGGFDAHARRVAERHGAVAIERVDSRRFRLVGCDGTVASLLLRHGAEATLMVDNAPATRITVDAIGRSPDYDLLIQLNDLEQRITIAGLTGWIEETDP